MTMMTGTRTKEIVVNRQDATNMKYNTTAAWVIERRKTFRLRQT